MDNELFEKTPIPRAYMTLAIPVVLSMMVTLVYNTVDTYFIAHTGNTNMVAGVAIATPVFTVMIALGDIFGLGGSSVISRLYGQGRYDDGRRLSVFCFWGAVLTGILVIILGLAFHDPILRMLGADDSTWRYASQFYSLIILGSPFIIVSMTPTNLLRTEGFAGPSAIGSVAGTVINICLNPLFIHVFGWGAAGSAGATVIANICTDAYYVWFLIKRSRNLSLDPRLMIVSSGAVDVSRTGEPRKPGESRNPRKLALTRREAADILAIGIPASITNLMQSLGIIMVNLCLLSYGTDAVAAMGIALKIVMIAVMILVAFAFGGQPLIGYNYGAGNMQRLKDLLKFAYSFLSLLALAMTALLIAFAHPLMGFFTTDPHVVELGSGMLRVQLLSTVCVAIVLVTTCTFQSAGKAVGALLLSISRQGVMLAITLFVGKAIAGYHGVIAAQAVADLLTAVLAVVLFVVLLPEARGRARNIRKGRE
ncbi:MATE family efflux transporter [Bifidobacterium sp. 64T4]|uniref:MATE family efflux transporter n=1 Tax=Bifidobacterium pongonis TaxID=2834432 RepID=UPI001C57F96B|nr:MATE family efflux transporter [Bifidobacterium pongonis]MBW3095009.1 MATE family efflux transporter [Bifidobacterium pongonis]